MKHTEMMALSNRGGTRTAVERASAWLLSHLEAGSCLDAAGWVSARAIELARSEDRRESCRAEQGAPMVTANRRHRETASRLSRSVDVSRGGLEVQALSGVRCGQRCAGDGPCRAGVDPACGGDPLPWSAVLVR